MANSPTRSVVDVGSVIADTYKIEGLIGRGGMGAVFLASHNRLPGKKVAIKVLHAELHDEELLSRFKREAQIASMLGHPNIVGVHDFNVTPDGMPYLVLDYLEGETLAHKIQRGPMPIDQVQSIIRQVGSALAVAHREGIVHRDLKPQNIFLVPTEVDGKLVEIAKVLDFGISKWRGSQTVKTQESTLLGTPQYMAPEQATGKHDSVDQRTDVFALGVIVHEMLCGQPAFSGASIPEVVFKVVYEEPAPLPGTVPAQLANAVKQAMSKAADARHANVSAFVEALTGQPISTFRGSAVAPPEIGFAAGSKRMSEQDALANTMGSGDYGSQIPPVPNTTRVDVSAPTVDSQRSNAATPVPPATIAGVAPAGANTASRGGAAASLATAPAPVATEPTATASVVTENAPTLASPAAASPPRKRTGILITATLGGIAAITVVAILALGGKDKPTQTANAPSPPPPPQNVKVASPETEAPRPVVSPELPNRAGSAAPIQPVEPSGSAAAGSSAEMPAVAKPTTKPTPKPTAKPPVEDDEASDPDLAAMSARMNGAVDAYRAGNLDKALSEAKAVINGGGPRQAARAHVLRGKIFCEKSDAESLNIELRSLKGFPKHERELMNFCSRR